MRQAKDQDYYLHLHTLITDALLFLLMSVHLSSRFMPVAKRNEVLVRYLKPKLKEKNLADIKGDIRLMLNTARNKNGNLEKKLYLLNTQSKAHRVAGAELLYHLLVVLYDKEGIESKLLDESQPCEPGILYILEEHLEHCFKDGVQIAPVSLFIELERAPELIEVINQHSLYVAEMKEWNAMTHQAHMLLHPGQF
ncbi:DUF2913 family protein [Vibrio genomosp. F6]|uniref:DUF2913 family protein n=1 Tax=Vibrio genomosp. F6 str. FF-238 TaxID=1191298 RepID=A0A1E5CSC6_9VIBR|nr:DUF2913 family protein [Vibrio genomosp. F6]OEE72827.1 hypothetical protein A130_07090 [Vibrio genomosp. F6 str. FF-238]